MVAKFQKDSQRQRLLVAIASYGEKNIGFLKRLILNYRNMGFETDVVVLSEKVKDLGPGVELIVGLPTTNPWSLPFGHKKLFAERKHSYDLFIYSEDDIEVTEANIRAFIRATEILPSAEIAGFLRYEIADTGAISFPDMHGPYHWKAESVEKRGELTIAEFTNEHSAFYILTQAQLLQAIASGGFLREPYEAKHDMLCAAATDPYTSCGFRKVIPLSRIDDFLVHHLSNRYAGQVGLTRSEFAVQNEILLSIRDGKTAAFTLCDTQTKILRGNWSKSYYEAPQADVLQLVLRSGPKNVLSIGCGWGAAEKIIQKHGVEVTALPLDAVVGALAFRQGISVVNGTLEEALAALSEQRFDVVFMTDLLHLLPDPWSVLQSCANLVKPKGSFVISGPNFRFLPVFFRSFFRVGGFRMLHDYKASGTHPFSAAKVARKFSQAGFKDINTRWVDMKFQAGLGIQRASRVDRFLARSWVMCASR